MDDDARGDLVAGLHALERSFSAVCRSLVRLVETSFPAAPKRPGAEPIATPERAVAATPKSVTGTVLPNVTDWERIDDAAEFTSTQAAEIIGVTANCFKQRRRNPAGAYFIPHRQLGKYYLFKGRDLKAYLRKHGFGAGGVSLGGGINRNQPSGGRQ